MRAFLLYLRTAPGFSALAREQSTSPDLSHSPKPTSGSRTTPVVVSTHAVTERSNAARSVCLVASVLPDRERSRLPGGVGALQAAAAAVGDGCSSAM